MLRSIGIFFLLISILGIVIFISSIRTGDPIWELGLFSTFGTFLGLFFIRRFSPPPNPDERFQTLRSYRSRRQASKDSKKDKKK
jgi:hypothetical protein